MTISCFTRRIACFVAFLALAAQPGCKKKEGEPCEAKSECKKELICFDHACAPVRGDGESCGAAADCLPGRACAVGECVEPAALRAWAAGAGKELDEIRAMCASAANVRRSGMDTLVTSDPAEAKKKLDEANAAADLTTGLALERWRGLCVKDARFARLAVQGCDETKEDAAAPCPEAAKINACNVKIGEWMGTRLASLARQPAPPPPAK